MRLANFNSDLSEQLSGGPAIVAAAPVTAHAAGTASMHVATAVTIADAGNFYASGTVEGALQELGTAVGTAYVLSSYGGKETLDSGNTGTAYTIDLAAGNVHDLTINAGTAVLTLTGATNLYACSATVLLRQDASGNRLVTWPGSVEWPGGTTPTLGTAANAVDVFSLFTLDGGTVWYGFEAGGAAAGTASNTVLIYDEGSLMGTATAVDFLGSGVSAAMSGGTAQVTVTTGTASSNIPIYDEGSLMGTATTGLNFTGSGVSGTVTSGTAVITISGGSGVNAGTAFPGGPSDNDLYFRTDRDILYYYNSSGTAWLSVDLYREPLNSEPAIPISATNTTGRWMDWTGGVYDIWLVQVDTTTYHSSVTGSNYWSLSIIKGTAAESESTLGSFVTSSDTSSNWTVHSVSVGALLGTTYRYIRCSATKNASATPLYAYSTVHFRLVG